MHRSLYACAHAQKYNYQAETNNEIIYYKALDIHGVGIRILFERNDPYSIQVNKNLGNLKCNIGIA